MIDGMQEKPASYLTYVINFYSLCEDNDYQMYKHSVFF